MADKQEREPLLQNSDTPEGPQNPPPQYTPYSEGAPGTQQALPPDVGYSGGPPTGAGNPVVLPPIREDELPPPYTPTPVLSINCKVCQQIIPLEGKQNQNVVKCNFCKEATPIKAAPPGKKYVRCPCNCLLICRANAAKIACPRQNCKRIITMNAPGMVMPTAVVAGNLSQVQCSYCNAIAQFSLVGTSFMRCPSCNRVSSVNSAAVRTRMIIYLILGIVFLGAGTGVTIGTYEMAARSGGIYTVWIGAYIIGAVFLIRACLWGRIQTSTVIGPA